MKHLVYLQELLSISKSCSYLSFCLIFW